MRGILLFSVLSTCICGAQTPAVCPWFSTGSAASVLGGPVTLSAHIESNSQGMCRFAPASGDEKRFLEIAVGKEDSHACPPDSTKMIALGNEAAQCKSTSARGQPLNVIAGRVRNVHFVVRLGAVPNAATIPSETGHPADPYAATTLERVAEQVVGNLF